MTPPLFLVSTVVAGEQVVDGAEGHHAAAVRRVRRGERVDLGDGNGTLGLGQIVAVGRGAVTVDVREVVQVPPPMPRIVVAQGLVKGERADHALAMMTEVGVDAVIPWQASRSVVTWSPERRERALARWRATVREASKQAHRAWLPEVAEPVDTTALCATVLAAGRAYVLDESADPAQGSASALTRPTATEGPILIVVGPEGGVTDDEVATLQAAGATPVRLGANVMRADTAGTVAVALLSAGLGRW